MAPWDERQKEGDEAEEQGRRNTGKPQAEALQDRLRQRGPDQAVDDAPDRAARNLQQTFGAAAHNALRCGRESPNAFCPITKEEEGDEHAQAHLEESLTEAHTDFDQPISGMIEIGSELRRPVRPEQLERLPLLGDLRTQER